MIQVSDQWLDAKRELLISEYRASHDIMTGLWNKTSGVDQVRNCLENMSESDMAVLGFMDIDNFKSVNDTYGHETGVFWIREVATALQEMCGPSDIACRYGGDEFIIVIESCARYELENIAKDIYARIADADGFSRQIKKYLNHEVEFNEEKNITCSIGISYERNVTSESQITELIKKADDLMYTVKTGEKGHYAFF